MLSENLLWCWAFMLNLFSVNNPSHLIMKKWNKCCLFKKKKRIVKQSRQPLIEPQRTGHLLRRFSHVWPFVTLWTVAHQALQSMGSSRQEYWSGLPGPSPGDLPDPGIEPTSHYVSCIAGGFITSSAARVKRLEAGGNSSWIGPSRWEGDTGFIQQCLLSILLEHTE